jgi:hypothetical protein
LGSKPVLRSIFFLRARYRITRSIIGYTLLLAQRRDYYRGTKTPDEITEYYIRGGEQTRFHSAQGQLEALRTQELLAPFLPAQVITRDGWPRAATGSR